MVARHKDIANYFFLKRKGPDDLTISEIYAGIVVHDGGEDQWIRQDKNVII